MTEQVDTSQQYAPSNLWKYHFKSGQEDMLKQVKKKLESLLITDPAFLTNFCQRHMDSRDSVEDVAVSILFKDKPAFSYFVLS